MDPSVLALVASFVGKRKEETLKSSEAMHISPILEKQTIHRIKVIIFTKDRPWQLQQLFRSMSLTTTTTTTTKTTTQRQLIVDIIIIGLIQDIYSAAYKQIEREIRETIQHKRKDWSVQFWNEDEQHSFTTLLCRISKHTSSLTMFLTDDCVLLAPLLIILETASAAMDQSPEILAFLTRLHPGITRSQTKERSSPPPRNHLQYLPLPNSNKAYTYPLHLGRLEWNYPFDLSGGIYRQSTIVLLIEKLKNTDGLSHPNRFETYGNQILSTQLQNKTRCAIPTKPTLLILDINRVQSIYQTHITASCENDYSPFVLLEYWRKGKHLDLLYYQRNPYNATHIGDVVIEINNYEEVLVNDSPPQLSVLLPVHTGPPLAAADAIRSIIMQPIMDESENCPCSRIQIVIIDDRCSDGSILSMLKEARRIEKDYEYKVSVHIRDYRMPNENDITFQRPGTFVQITLDVYSSPQPGVPSALNFGLGKCRSDIVARMDADDISAPGRFSAQLGILHCRSTLDVVGTQTILFRERASTHPNDRFGHEVELSANDVPFSTWSEHPTVFVVRTSLPPTDPGFVSWALIFSCCLAHSSVMFRKLAVLEAGGYDESISNAEDYDLWLRMTSKKCSSITSLPQIGLWHRKHNSRNPERAQKQAEQASCLASLIICNLVDNASPQAIETLRHPGGKYSLHSFNEAATLLLTLESVFLHRYAATLTNHERQLIRSDCDDRLGELSILAATRFENVAHSVVWKLWCDRCPDRLLDQISILSTILTDNIASIP